MWATTPSHLFLPSLNYLIHFFPLSFTLGSHLVSNKTSFSCSVMFFKLSSRLFIKMPQSAHFLLMFIPQYIHLVNLITWITPLNIFHICFRAVDILSVLPISCRDNAGYYVQNYWSYIQKLSSLYIILLLSNIRYKPAIVIKKWVNKIDIKRITIQVILFFLVIGKWVKFCFSALALFNCMFCFLPVCSDVSVMMLMFFTVIIIFCS